MCPIHYPRAKVMGTWVRATLSKRGCQSNWTPTKELKNNFNLDIEIMPCLEFKCGNDGTTCYCFESLFRTISYANLLEEPGDIFLPSAAAGLSVIEFATTTLSGKCTGKLIRLDKTSRVC